MAITIAGLLSFGQRWLFSWDDPFDLVHVFIELPPGDFLFIFGIPRLVRVAVGQAAITVAVDQSVFDDFAFLDPKVECGIGLHDVYLFGPDTVADIGNAVNLVPVQLGDFMIFISVKINLVSDACVLVCDKFGDAVTGKVA